MALACVTTLAAHSHSLCSCVVRLAVLGKTEEQDMAPGANALNFHVEAIDVSALSKHVLANVGLISLDLYAFDPPQNIVHVGMVTQVSEEDGRLIRHVFNPIE